MRSLLLAGLLLMCGAAPAGAVINGSPIAPESVPWFVSVNGCGGTLVAPDRVLTAGHCAADAPVGEIDPIAIGGETRRAIQIAQPPGWRHANGARNFLDDVAILALDRPVTTVAPVALGGAPAAQGTIIGTGRKLPPGSGNESAALSGALTGAPLRTLPDAECAAAYRTARGNGGERYDGRSMLCATDPDGAAPYNSGCNGDSGGPFMSGGAQVGVVSFGGARCGADHLPSVFAEVARYRSFILAASPTWKPEASRPARISGHAKLTCTAPRFTGRPKLEYEWIRIGTTPRPTTIGHGRTYRVRSGGLINCRVFASNAGGRTVALAQPVKR